MKSERQRQRPRPTRVSIVGGGCAAMAAAFELTHPRQRGRFAVTVYQLGWRLGGKGASGRGVADRIEEHGLHLWMGYYENAFRLMRDCYAELGRDPRRCPIADWTQAFSPAHGNAVADRTPAGAWLPWLIDFPATPGSPGDGADQYRSWSVRDYLVRTAALARTLFRVIQLRTTGSDGESAPEPGAAAPPVLGMVMGRILRYGELLGFQAIVEALRIVEQALAAMSGGADDLLLPFQEAVTRAIRAQIDRCTTADDEVRRLWEVLEVVLTVLRGAIRAGLATDPRGFDALDDYEWRDWLRENGASDAALDGAFVRALYDLVFAYEDGDVSRPRIGAGQALRGSMRAFFTYRGAFFWKMHAGMGDIVFAPFYEVLKKRGVRFRFFHRLTNVGIADDGKRPHVSALEFDVQARTVGGRDYRPLKNVRGLPSWPAEPDYAQLAGGARLRREGRSFEAHADRRRAGKLRLRVKKDFDFVVLAVGLGAIPHLCPEILQRDRRWREMVARVKTVGTQAFQIWMKPKMKDLGWKHGPVSLSGFVEPFDTWADMSHLAPIEGWPEKKMPGAIGYFCSVLPDGHGPDPAAEVRAGAIEFLEREVRHLWPKAVAAGRFKWDLLMEPPSVKKKRRGQERFDGQYWRANVDPSDRYVLSLPGSNRFRISPLDDTYDNLAIAGDWTDSGLNMGCVESAVMSGRLASHALSQSPPLEEIVGFDHP
jgi:uncharacterized protein with NAD-binding domain and iron-sulfur cluster